MKYLQLLLGVYCARLSSKLTRIALPVKVVLGVAMALQLCAQVIASWAMRKWDVVVCNIVEKVDFFFLEHQTSSDGVDRSIAPALVEKSAIAVQRIEIVDVGFRPEPVEIANLKV